MIWSGSKFIIASFSGYAGCQGLLLIIPVLILLLNVSGLPVSIPSGSVLVPDCMDLPEFLFVFQYSLSICTCMLFACMNEFSKLFLFLTGKLIDDCRCGIWLAASACNKSSGSGIISVSSYNLQKFSAIITEVWLFQ